MHFVKSFSEFVDVTGMLIDDEDVIFLGLSPDSIIGCFWLGSMKPVLDFCRNNPKFHIATYLGDGIFVNRFQESEGLFWIADGDQSPDIWYDDSKYYRQLFF